MDQETQGIPRQVALKLLDISWEVLGEQYTRPPNLDEMSEFAEVLASNLLAAAYLAHRASENPENAEKWLRKAMNMVSAVVRTAGSDALIKVDLSIKEAPNKLMKHAPEDPPSEAVPAPVCACEKTEGQCLSCRNAMAARVQEVYGSISTLLHYKETKDPCPVCSVTEFDAALAQSVPVFGKCAETMEKEALTKFAQDLIGVLSTMAAMKGLKEMPLTLQAWKDLFKAKGIEVS